MREEGDEQEEEDETRREVWLAIGSSDPKGILDRLVCLVGIRSRGFGLVDTRPLFMLRRICPRIHYIKVDTDAEMRMLFLQQIRIADPPSCSAICSPSCAPLPTDPTRLFFRRIACMRRFGIHLVSRTSAWQLISGLIRSSVREPPVVSAEEPCQVQTSPRLTASAAGMLISRFRGGNPLLSAQ